MPWIDPLVLAGKTVRLLPLENQHVDELAAAGQDEVIWKYMRYGAVTGRDKMQAFIADLLAWQARGTDLPFAVYHIADRKLVGMTRYLDISQANRSVEIGGTWYGVAYQHTGVNTECKYLLLKHAFEDLRCIRVQFKADARNERSQKALVRIGAVREGLLRDHIILPDGTIRSSVYFSILAEEWPAVKDHLESLLAR
jgi:RimJ/RimL family protein N-acetyltransferase